MNADCRNGDSDFRGSTDLDGSSLAVRLAGNADSLAKDNLDTLMNQVLTQIEHSEINTVAVDFRELDFMSSSCFKSMVTWLDRMAGLSGEQRCRVSFELDPDVYWQRRGVRTLSAFAGDLMVG